MAPKESGTTPPCYAMVHHGLEQVASDEIKEKLDGDIRKALPGFVMFRPGYFHQNLLNLRTTEDVFLLAWASGALTKRASDLDLIQKWTTREADWSKLIALHQQIRPKKHARMTFRYVVQMEGERAFFRRDAREVFAKAVARHIPPKWVHVDENADIEFWLTIDQTTAVSGVRLSDRSMRHRLDKWIHRPASLRPSVAASMVRLAKIRPGDPVLDPCCGSGTILAEHMIQLKDLDEKAPPVCLGGDIEAAAVSEAQSNLRSYGDPFLANWDSALLPVESESIGKIVVNPPFGKQIGDPEEMPDLYKEWSQEWFRVGKPGCRLVAVTSMHRELNDACVGAGWKSEKKVLFSILGQRATISVWIKPY